MSRLRVLISGASIAGPALAYWLNRYGYETTIVERAPELRTGGQNVDVRGAGREVSRRMGIEGDIRNATTGEQGTRFIGSNGAVVADFPAGTSDTAGATAELEILRGDLARLLVDRTADGTDYRFGDRISGIRDSTGDAVTVSFDEEPTIRSLGLETSYATIPRTGADDDWWRWYNAPGGRSITLRPDAHGTIRAAMSFVTDRSEAPGRSGGDRRTVAEQRVRLRARFEDAGWQARRVLDGFDRADDLYFESIGQVHAPRWSSGRVALLGDAAYCASPVSGMGTSLSLTGAYVLAGELAAHVDHRGAFRGYERIMRPYVDQAQKLPPGVPRVANPTSRLGVAAFHTAVRLASSPFANTLGDRFFSPPADRIELPDYSHLG